MTADVWPALFLRSIRKENGRGRTGNLPKDKESEQAADDDPVIRCRNCLQAITRPADRITKAGAHRHAFANPHGIVYEIGCFKSVVHCGFAGSPTAEFSWFAGYTWQVTYCGACLTHLGWAFQAPGKDMFFGLILKHLRQPGESR